MKKTLSFLAIILLISSNIYSQKVYDLSRNDSAMLVEYNAAYLEQYKIGHLKEATNYLNLSAMLLWTKNHFDEAETKFLKSLELNKKLANQNGVAMINNNLAMIYADKGDYIKSLNYFEETLLARRVAKEKIGIISALINQSVVFTKLKKYDKSVKNLEEALDLAREMNDDTQMRSCYGMLSETYQKAGDTKKSLYYYEYFRTFNNYVTEKTIKKSKEEVKNERLQRELAELEKQNKELELFRTEKELKKSEGKIKTINAKQEELLKTLSKQEMSLRIITQESTIKELENKTLKNEKAQQRTVITIISIAFLLIAIVLVFIFRLYRQKNEYNKQLLLKNQEVLIQNLEINQHREEIETQRDALEDSNVIIQKKNESITNSINYARNIQSAMLNRKTKLSNYVTKSFILFKPRDIVSGDFYWYAKIKHKKFIIVSDCTGHGVPGAFISMIGNNILTDLIMHQNIHNPSEILFELNKGVVEALNQNHSDNSDGMDIAICVIDEENKELEYAGAKSPIILFQSDMLNYVKPDTHSVGGVHRFRKKKKTNKFITKIFDIADQETSVYMFSDGIIDQFDSTDSNKFTRKRFKEILEKSQELSMEDQKIRLDQVLNNWKGNTNQTDDITVLGFKLNY